MQPTAQNMIPIKLMPDYQCYPLWNTSAEAYGNIDPKTLPISKTLQMDLQRWSETFESATNQGQTDFSSPQAKIAFQSQGSNLRDALQAELGGRYHITLHAGR